MRSFISLLLQRTLKVLCFITLMSCSSSGLKQWQFQSVETQSPKFNSGRLILPPDEECEYLELELVRNGSGIRFYLNLFFSQARPWEYDSTRTTVEIFCQNPSAHYIIHPHLLLGGQRILLDKEDADYLIELLKNDQEFTLKLGRHEMKVIPTSFLEHYRTLMNLSLE
jgi:hypothetical protein